MSVSSTTSNMFTHLQYFLRACLMSHNAGYNNPYVGSNELTSAPSMAARQWAKEKIRFFSDLAQETASASTGVTLPQGPYLLALITEVKTTTTTTPTNPLSSTADEKHDKSKGMSRSELNTTLQMCGKSSTGDMMDITAWM